jgi:AcrR family transcriptional regulator
MATRPGRSPSPPSLRRGAAAVETREKIQRVAERLFAVEGFDRVTLRQIARAAGQRNVAAVQYHFGGKEALLAEIITRHQTEIDAARRDLLDEDEEQGRERDLDALLRVLVEPLAAKLDVPSGRAYLQIQAQRITPDALLPATRVMATRISRALEPVRPDATSQRLVTLLLFHSLADRARQEETDREPSVDRAAFVRKLTRALRALYRDLEPTGT